VVKLDNLIQIAHNVGNREEYGDCRAGGVSRDHLKLARTACWRARVGIAGHLTIANNTSLGAQSGISKSIMEEGARLMGSPAFEFGTYFKSYAVFKKLPDINHRLKETGG
jgi:UDP-3-O-[3-hydroxymyristoyl] glucosamine N-acyltransferase